MTDRPPAPPTPTALHPIDGSDDRVVATTTQLATRIEDALECRLDTAILEELLLELDRGGYVEWVTITRTGDYVWDLTDSPERIAETVAAAVVSRVERWLDGGSGA